MKDSIALKMKLINGINSCSTISEKDKKTAQAEINRICASNDWTGGFENISRFLRYSSIAAIVIYSFSWSRHQERNSNFWSNIYDKLSNANL